MSVKLWFFSLISFSLYVWTKGTTACYTRPDCLLWTNPIPNSDCSSLEENAISRCSSFAGLIFAEPLCFEKLITLDACVSICACIYAIACFCSCLTWHFVVHVCHYSVYYVGWRPSNHCLISEWCNSLWHNNKVNTCNQPIKIMVRICDGIYYMNCSFY